MPLRLAATLLLLSLALLCAAADKDKESEGGKGGLLKYGMALEEAEKVIAGEDWQVAYRIDTPSTSEIAALWQDSVFYLARFFDGRCFFIEKRAQVPAAEVEALIGLYTRTYGMSPESSRDRNDNVIYARWDRAEREVSIYAIRGGADGLYKLMYEESDPQVRSAARRTQESELAAAPREEDPLTGRIRINPLGSSAVGPDDPNEPEAEVEEGDEEEDETEDDKEAEDSE